MFIIAPPTTEIYTLSLHDALPIFWEHADRIRSGELPELAPLLILCDDQFSEATLREERELILTADVSQSVRSELLAVADRKSTRLNSSHTVISYAVFCLKKKIDEK